MKTRKVISAILAGVCALSAMGISTFAEDSGTTTTPVADTNKVVSAGGATTYKISGAPVVPKIDVSIPATVMAAINPYGVEVTDAKGNTYGSTGVASPVYTIRNYTTTSAIAVKATASLTVPTVKPDPKGKATENSFEVVTTETKIESVKTAKSKQLAAYVVGVSGTDCVGTGDKGVSGTNIVGVDKDTEDGIVLDVTTAPKAYANKNNSYTGAVIFADSTQTLDTNGGKNEVNPANYGIIMNIPAAELYGESDTTVAKDSKGNVLTKTYGFGKFAVAGNVSPNTLEDGAWTAADKVTFNLVLDLQPGAAPATKADGSPAD